MMKMHGLGDSAYWAIQYAWFIAVYALYMVVLVAFGSAIGLHFFRATDYSLQLVFYLLWGNCLVAFAFWVRSQHLDCAGAHQHPGCASCMCKHDRSTTRVFSGASACR